MNTMQQEFDIVVDHLFKQGGPALSGQGGCSYRNKEGKTCAVGCRIPDSVYHSSMEGLMLPDLDQYRLPEELRVYGEMFLNLQQIHDNFVVYDIRHTNFMSWESWLNHEFSNLANELGLRYESR